MFLWSAVSSVGVRGHSSVTWTRRVKTEEFGIRTIDDEGKSDRHAERGAGHSCYGFDPGNREALWGGGGGGVDSWHGISISWERDAEGVSWFQCQKPERRAVKINEE